MKILSKNGNLLKIILRKNIREEKIITKIRKSGNSKNFIMLVKVYKMKKIFIDIIKSINNLIKLINS